MRREDWPQIALGFLVALAVIGGILTIGGPLTGRAEKRDATRYEDLTDLQGLLECIADSSNEQLPDALAITEKCSQHVRLQDPYTNASYLYEKLSAATYRLCAEFEAPASLERFRWVPDNFDPTTGCLFNSYHR